MPFTNSSENGSDVSINSSIEESVASSSVEENGSVGLAYTLNGDNTYWVSSFGDCQDSEIIIPSTYQGKAVTGIAQEAFAYTETIASVYIPASVKKIQANAFLLCMNLEKSNL